jgi:hypothetical protein
MKRNNLSTSSLEEIGGASKTFAIGAEIINTECFTDLGKLNLILSSS